MGSHCSARFLLSPRDFCPEQTVISMGTQNRTIYPQTKLPNIQSCCLLDMSQVSKSALVQNLSLPPTILFLGNTIDS